MFSLSAPSQRWVRFVRDIEQGMGEPWLIHALEQYLVEAGPPFLYHQNWQGRNLAHFVCSYGTNDMYFKIFEFLFDQAPLLCFKSKDICGRNCLMMAIESGNIRMAAYLLQRQAEIMAGWLNESILLQPSNKFSDVVYDFHAWPGGYPEAPGGYRYVFQESTIEKRHEHLLKTGVNDLESPHVSTFELQSPERQQTLVKARKLGAFQQQQSTQSSSTQKTTSSSGKESSQGQEAAVAKRKSRRKENPRPEFVNPKIKAPHETWNEMQSLMLSPQSGKSKICLLRSPEHDTKPATEWASPSEARGEVQPDENDFEIKTQKPPLSPPYNYNVQKERIDKAGEAAAKKNLKEKQHDLHLSWEADNIVTDWPKAGQGPWVRTIKKNMFLLDNQIDSLACDTEPDKGEGKEKKKKKKKNQEDENSGSAVEGGDSTEQKSSSSADKRENSPIVTEKKTKPSNAAVAKKLERARQKKEQAKMKKLEEKRRKAEEEAAKKEKTYLLNPPITEDVDENGRDAIYYSVKAKRYRVTNFLRKEPRKSTNDELLSLACQIGCRIAVRTFIRDIDQIPPLALHWCVTSQDKECTKLLLDRKADIDGQDPHTGDTALHIAVRRSNPILTEMLIQYGADPLVKNHVGKIADDFGYINFRVANDCPLAEFNEDLTKKRKQICVLLRSKMAQYRGETYTAFADKQLDIIYASEKKQKQMDASLLAQDRNAMARRPSSILFKGSKAMPNSKERQEWRKYSKDSVVRKPSKDGSHMVLEGTDGSKKPLGMMTRDEFQRTDGTRMSSKERRSVVEAAEKREMSYLVEERKRMVESSRFQN